jgi:hypothetical protein
MMMPCARRFAIYQFARRASEMATFAKWPSGHVAICNKDNRQNEWWTQRGRHFAK